MSIRPIVRFPDPRLQAIAAPVTTFDAELHTLANDLLDTMRAAPGVGITAPHIGVAQRLVLLELEPKQVRIYVNPQIVWTSQEKIRHTEGSVSMPGVTDEIERHAAIEIAYQDLHGRELTEKAEGARDRPARRHLLDPAPVEAQARPPDQALRQATATLGRRKPLMPTPARVGSMAPIST